MEQHGNNGQGDGLQGIFLDFYGTLAAGDRQAVEAVCQRIIDDHGLDGCCTDLSVRWGLRYFAAIEEDAPEAFRLLREIEHDTLIETCASMVEVFDALPYIEQLNSYLGSPPLFEEVKAVLDAIDLPVCIVSNADEREIRAAMEAHGLVFDYVVTSESARSYKPHPGIFRYALRLTGWHPSRVLHVGDSLHSDVEGARRLGIRTAWVNRADRISDIGTAEPDHTWADLRPLMQIR
jgi:2-haloacid dehalogenase/putative hydrolase of the HAD superfamily